MKQVNWGIIGVGDVCEVKSAPAMNKISNSKIIAVMRRDAEKAEDYAKRHKINEWTTDADTIINHPEINAIYIATPPKFHKEYALKVAKARKACYIEKPMATNYHECVEIEKAFKAKNIPLFIAYYRTCLPNFLKAKELINDGKLGKLLNVQMKMNKPLDKRDDDYYNRNWRVDPELAGDGYFYDLGSHQLNILEFLIGDIEYIHGFATNQSEIYEASDVVAATVIFKNGTVGSCFWAFNQGVPERQDELVINGSDGALKMTCFDDSPITFTNSKGKSEKFHIEYPKHVQQPLIASIVEDLLNETTNTYSTGSVGTKTNYWLEKTTGLL
ncbi:Gfo/Idh/MocA family protein [Wenyingzhuangia sp. IMCC45574]